MAHCRHPSVAEEIGPLIYCEWVKELCGKPTKIATSPLPAERPFGVRESSWEGAHPLGLGSGEEFAAFLCYAWAS